MYRKTLKLSLTFFLLITITIYLSSCISVDPFTKDNVNTVALSQQGSFYLNVNNQKEETFLKGVNVGATIPGHFPGELAIDKETYLRWFEMIDEMNANVIRVYTTMNPVFYDALFEFNENKTTPLYLLQGVWINETDISELLDAYAQDRKIIDDLITDTIDLIDIFHGNKTLPERPGFASGKYTQDISEYVIGWILGIEWDPNFVIGTNEANAHKTIFEGEYLYTKKRFSF